MYKHLYNKSLFNKRLLNPFTQTHPYYICVVTSIVDMLSIEKYIYFIFESKLPIYRETITKFQ